MIQRRALIALALSLSASVAVAQPAAAAAASSASAVQAGTYKVDPNHTQVVWSVNHMGFSRLYGMVGQFTGTLQIDPARPAASTVEIDIPMSGMTVTSPGFANHLKTPDLFDTAKFPTGKFVSKSVAVNGQSATITGDLTMHGVTKPVVLQATFFGAGANPQSKKPTVGFSAKTQLKRSDFGLGFAVPVVSDEVDLEITAAFEQ